MDVVVGEEREEMLFVGLGEDERGGEGRGRGELVVLGLLVLGEDEGGVDHGVGLEGGDGEIQGGRNSRGKRDRKRSRGGEDRVEQLGCGDDKVLTLLELLKGFKMGFLIRLLGGFLLLVKNIQGWFRLGLLVLDLLFNRL